MTFSSFKRVPDTLDRMFYGVSGFLFEKPATVEAGRQFMTFAVIGVINTAIDFSIYILLTRHTRFFDYRTDWRYAANTISFLTATTFSFFVNRAWTFRRTAAPSWGEALRFYATTLSGLVINNGVLFLFSQIGGINDIVSKIFSTVFSMVWNFTFKKFWVFSEKTKTI